MENRRQHYRHPFPASHRLKVTLKYPNYSFSLAGEMTDLSLGGMGVALANPGLPDSKNWIAIFALESEEAPFQIRVEPVYAPADSGKFFGFRFLYPVLDSARAAQEKALFKFLLEEQRRERRELKQATRTHEGG